MTSSVKSVSRQTLSKMVGSSRNLICSYIWMTRVKIQDDRHNCRFLKVIHTNIPPGVLIDGSHLIPPRTFITITPPEPQVIERNGVFTKRFSFGWRGSRFKSWSATIFKMAAMTSYVKYSSWCAYWYYVVLNFSHWSKIQYGRYGSHFDFFPKICDDFSSRTTSGRDMGFSP